MASQQTLPGEDGGNGSQVPSACPVQHMWPNDKAKAHPMLPLNAAPPAEDLPSNSQVPAACPPAEGSNQSPSNTTSSSTTSSQFSSMSGKSMDGCPMSAASRDQSIDPKNQMPVQPNQQPAPGQRFALPTDRYRSSIPKAATTPGSANQPNEEEAWLYPSPQMFYNAMRRKGWDPREEDMTAVVSIHNAVNERSWSQVLEWERLHERHDHPFHFTTAQQPHVDLPDVASSSSSSSLVHSECQRPRLARFRGRPTDLSPKARMMSWLGYKLPFDRHDWIVDRCGTEVRYVIDFYQGEVPQGADAHHQAPPSAFFLDVRPALDSFGSAYDRIRMGLHSTFPSAFSIGKEKDLS